MLSNHLPAASGNVSSEVARNYKALRLRRCLRKNTSTPAAIINITVSTIWVIAFSFPVNESVSSLGTDT